MRRSLRGCAVWCRPAAGRREASGIFSRRWGGLARGAPTPRSRWDGRTLVSDGTFQKVLETCSHAACPSFRNTPLSLSFSLSTSTRPVVMCVNTELRTEEWDLQFYSMCFGDSELDVKHTVCVWECRNIRLYKLDLHRRAVCLYVSWSICVYARERGI